MSLSVLSTNFPIMSLGNVEKLALFSKDHHRFFRSFIYTLINHLLGTKVLIFSTSFPPHPFYCKYKTLTSSNTLNNEDKLPNDLLLHNYKFNKQICLHVIEQQTNINLEINPINYTCLTQVLQPYLDIIVIKEYLIPINNISTN